MLYQVKKDEFDRLQLAKRSQSPNNPEQEELITSVVKARREDKMREKADQVVMKEQDKIAQGASCTLRVRRDKVPKGSKFATKMPHYKKSEKPLDSLDTLEVKVDEV
jgi:hypothetical protein